MLAWSPKASIRHETLGATPATSLGTTATSSATVNAKGAWVGLGTTGFDYGMVLINAGATTSGADYLVDIGLEHAAGSWTVLIADLRHHSRRAFYCGGAPKLLPIRVPTGTTLGYRTAASTAAASISLQLTGFETGLYGAPGWTRLVPLFTPATSRGVSIDPGATANTKSGWVELLSSSPIQTDALLVAVGPNGVTTRNSAMGWLIDIGIGASGSERPVLMNLAADAGTYLDVLNQETYGPFPGSIAAGTRIVARAQCSATAASERTIDLAVWGFAY